MKKHLLLPLLLLLSFSTAMAIPAHKGTRRIQQPDGSYVSLRLHGDEYMHFHSTDDGYTVVQNQQGYYVYATLDDAGQLQPTSQVAHEPAMRLPDEQAFVKGLARLQAPHPTADALAEQQAEESRRSRSLQQHKVAQYGYTKFRGLILLIEYNDRKFKYDNYQELMDAMVNQPNYTGNSITNIPSYMAAPYSGKCTGSVRDYFSDCSNGLFVPQFDVVGPIQVDRSQYYYGSGSNNSNRLIVDAINAADPQVDFSQYDGDNDGYVDMVYFVFAGFGSNFAGNDKRLLWPHASQVWNPSTQNNVRKDGKTLGRYACSTELYGVSEWNTLDGIGTICHEFSHVLGLPDFYDTDYEESGGTSMHPGDWSVMSSGSDLNYGRTPSCYTMFERYALGWANPQVIDREGHYTLENLEETNQGYRIDSSQKKEYFILENRQQTKWDQYLPYHGMLVFRVDSTNSSVWTNNKLNVNPKHNYFELVRAGGKGTDTKNPSLDSDPFPGTKRVRILNNITTPANLLSWSGKPTPWGLENITEKGSEISFDIVDVNLLTDLSLPEAISMGVGNSTTINETRTPDYAPYSLTWTTSNPDVCTIDENGHITGMAVGTATITVKDSGAKQLTASCTVTVKPWTVAGSISEFKALKEGQEASLQLNDAQVLYTYKNKWYVRDATGCLVFDNTALTAKRNNIINGFIYVSRSTADKLDLATAVKDITNNNALKITEGDTPEARVTSVSQLDDSDYADYITLAKSKLQLIEGLGLFAVSGQRRVNVFNVLGAKFSYPKSYDGKRFDITGILLTRTLGDEVIDVLSPLSNIVEATPDYYKLIYQIGEGGQVAVGDKRTLQGPGELEVMNDDDLTLTIVPAEDFTTHKILLDGSPIIDNPIVLEGILANHTLAVSFKHTQGIISLEQNPAAPTAIYTTDGRLAGSDSKQLPTGLYIVKSGNRLKKIIIK